MDLYQIQRHPVLEADEPAEQLLYMHYKSDQVQLLLHILRCQGFPRLHVYGFEGFLQESYIILKIRRPMCYCQAPNLPSFHSKGNLPVHTPGILHIHVRCYQIQLSVLLSSLLPFHQLQQSHQQIHVHGLS